ncbi:MAG: hypothetical protein R3C20_15715 [Planctomycetaceae bacterium]
MTKPPEESDNLPDPDILAQEIVDDLQTALEQFANIAAELKDSRPRSQQPVVFHQSTHSGFLPKR